MKKYIITSRKSKQTFELGYNDQGLLVFFDLSKFDYTAEQLAYLFGRMPTAEPSLQQAFADRFTIDELPSDLSFERFWAVYAKKINAKRCKPLFAKLDDADKLKAIVAVKHYDAYLNRTGRFKADPEKYIRNEYYAVEWQKER